MAGKRKNFRPYEQARIFVVALALTSMQDWIAYAKGNDAQGRVRPDDIPSNPWTVYRDELNEKGQKFSINEFIGCKLKRKTKTVSESSTEVKVTTPKAPKKPKEAQVTQAPVAEDAPDDSNMTPFEIARTAIQELSLKSRDEFYELKRKNMLPVGVPRNPDSSFKDEWKGWGDFLGNVKVAEQVSSATAQF